MKFAVMGSGGVGGYFGARLAAAGEDVSFIARGAHLAAIRRVGLRVTSARGDVRIVPANATDEPAEIGPVDIVLFATKLWDVAESGAACKPLLKDGTGIVAFQNGVDAEAVLAEISGAAHVIGGVAQISALIAEPGVIGHVGTMARLQFGELDGTRGARVEALLASCKAAGIEAEIPDDITKAIWQKFAMLAPFSGMTAVTRKPIGPLREDPQTRAMFEAAVAETVAVGQARGVALSDRTVGTIMGFLDGLPDRMTASMAEDLERGNRLELPWLSGAVVRLGRESGVETPVHCFIATVLKLSQDGQAS